MKKLILFLSIIALSQSTFSQKKDKFNFADLQKKFPERQSELGKVFIHADSAEKFMQKTFNFKSPARAVHPTGDQWATYEFYMKDGSIVYMLVKPGLQVTEITHRYNCQGRVCDFTTWTMATGEIVKGKL